MMIRKGIKIGVSLTSPVFRILLLADVGILNEELLRKKRVSSPLPHQKFMERDEENAPTCWMSSRVKVSDSFSLIAVNDSQGPN